MRLCAVIPTYNNVSTVADIVRRTLEYLPVIVVADGPTDGSLEAVRAIDDERLVVVAYTQNRGKGYALRQGFRKARELGYTHVVTLDSDGQHFPEDIPAMVHMARVRPEAIIIGSRGMQHDNMPAKNTFANRFSNFWFAVQTGMRLPDTQTGFRVYPLEHLHGEGLMTNRYEAELMLLVFSAWACTPVVPVPVRVYYPPREERVTYFRPARDFTRISVLNTLLCVLAVVYGLPRRYWKTIYYCTVFVLFALWCNAYLLWYSLTNRAKITTVLRHRLAVGARRFLSFFPCATFTLEYVEGATPIDENRPAIYIANHGSLLDTLLMLTLSDKLVMVGKTWVTHNIFFGRVASAMGIITVESGVENFEPIIAKHVAAGYSVGIFPEGTRTLNGDVLRFHRGAFYLAEQLQVPIQPLLLQGFFLALRKAPFYVGSPKQIRAIVLPEIMPDDTRFGEGYRARTKAIQHYYQELICEELS